MNVEGNLRNPIYRSFWPLGIQTRCLSEIANPPDLSSTSNKSPRGRAHPHPTPIPPLRLPHVCMPLGGRARLDASISNEKIRRALCPRRIRSCHDILSHVPRSDCLFVCLMRTIKESFGPMSNPPTSLKTLEKNKKMENWKIGKWKIKKIQMKQKSIFQF